MLFIAFPCFSLFFFACICFSMMSFVFLFALLVFACLCFVLILFACFCFYTISSACQLFVNPRPRSSSSSSCGNAWIRPFRACKGNTDYHGRAVNMHGFCLLKLLTPRQSCKYAWILPLRASQADAQAQQPPSLHRYRQLGRLLEQK